MVDNCCVVGVDDQEHGFGSVPVVFATMSGDLNIDDKKAIESIMKDCQEQLSENYIPKDIVFRKELPLTPVGKVDYRKLIQEYSGTSYVKKR